MAELDPRKASFKYKEFFGSVRRDAEGGYSLSKYLQMIQKYFDYHLLEPENAIIDEAHKSHILDVVLGQEDGSKFGHLCLTKYIMDRRYRSKAEWEPMDTFIRCYIDLLVKWIPLHRGDFLYGFYNDILYRRYKYYTDAASDVVAFVESNYAAHLDCSTVDEDTPGEVLLVYHIDLFRKAGGFDVVMRTISEPKPIGVPYFKHMIRFLWMIKPFYDEQIRTDILPRVPEAAFRSQLLNFDTQSLREINQKDMDVIFAQMRLILADTCDVEPVLLQHGYDFALKCLDANILTKRLLGLQWLTQQLTVTYVSKPDMKRMLLAKILESDFFTKVFRHSVMKKRVVENSTALLLWMEAEHALTDQHLECLFQSVVENHFTDQEVCDGIFDLLASLVAASTSNESSQAPGGAEGPDLAVLVWRRLKELPAEHWSARTVRLVGYIARDPDSPDEAMQWLWKALDDGGDIGSDGRAEVVSQLVHLPGAVQQRREDIRARFLDSGRLIYLRLLAGAVAALPPSDRRAAAEALFADVFDASVAAFARYRAEAAKVGTDKAVDVYPHLSEIRQRISLLATLVHEGHVSMTRQQMVRLWNAVMNLGDDAVASYVMAREERDACLEGMYKLATECQLSQPAQEDPFKDMAPQQDEEESFPLLWLLQLLAEHPEYASQSRSGHATLRETFELVNGTRNQMDFVAGNRGNRPVLKRLDVLGFDALWSAALSAAPGVADEANEYLEQLYLSPSPKLPAADAETLRRRFCEEAMRRMADLVASTLPKEAYAGRCTQLLKMIRHSIEQTTRVEDLAKKRDGISSNVPSEVPLKDPPKPRFSDQKGYVQLAIDSGMLPEFIPEELRYTVVSLLFDRFNWMRFDYWVGDLYENQELVLDMIDKSRGYKRVLPEGAAATKLANESLPSCATIIAAQSSHWDTFFALLESAPVPAVAQLGWEVMSLLDTDKALEQKIALDDAAAGAAIEWESLLGDGPTYKLLHSLQLLERSFIPAQNDSAAEHTRKTQWCKRFLRAGGFRYLIGLLHSLATQSDIHLHASSTQCLVRILDVVYRFMRAPLPASEFAPEAEGRSPLELSVSSENLMFSGPTVQDIPEVMFSLVHAHAVSEQSASRAQLGDKGFGQQQQVGNYALYLLIACILKVPSTWRTFRDALAENKVLETLCSKNARFAETTAERLLHLARMFNLPIDASSNVGAQPQEYLLDLLLRSYPGLRDKASRHQCRSAFTLLCGLTERTDSPVDLDALLSDLLKADADDDAAEPDEYLAGLMQLTAVLLKKTSDRHAQLGDAPASSSDVEEKLYTRLLETYLYAPLTEQGIPTAAAKSTHLRQACFSLLGALVAAGSLGGDGLDRGLDALGQQYMDGPVAVEWKRPVPGVDDGDDPDRATKTARFMGLRNMACTCYMNATVQQLFNVEPFVGGILSAPTPKRDAAAAAAAAKEREGRLKAFKAMAEVLRRVIADPADELVRLLHSQSDEYLALKGAEYQGQEAVAFLESLGWKDDGSGSLVLQADADVEAWQGHLRALNESVASIKAEEEEAKKQVDPVEMFTEFQRMFAHLAQGGARYFDPKRFVQNFPDFDGRPVDMRRQEDAFEFFQRLQYLLEEQLKGTGQSKIFEDLFGVREVQVLRCDQHARASRPQVAPVIPLGFAKNVSEALSQVYNAEGEWISGMFKCEQCAKNVRGRKTMAIESTSDYLVIYLKRYDEHQQKIKDEFVISENLNVSQWSNAVIHDSEDLVTSQNKPIATAGQAPPPPDSEAWDYELIGTLHHEGGSMNAGHYFSVIKKDDGTWWRFNDTNVTPFRQPLREENIGGECVMLFYRRKKLLLQHTPAKGPVNEQLERDVLAENVRLYRLKLLNERSLFETLLRLMTARAAQVEAMSAERRMWLGHLAVRFVFETLARFNNLSGSASLMGEWSSGVLQPLFAGSAPLGAWLLRSLLSDRVSWLKQFLLVHEETPIRQAFVQLVWSAVASVFPTEKVGVPQKRVVPAYKPEAAPLRDDLAVTVQLMDRVCSMSEYSRGYYQRHEEYWDLVARWANLGPIPRRHLAITEFVVYPAIRESDVEVSLDFPALVLDYFLGQYSVVKKNPMRTSIGDRQSLSLTRQFDAFALVMRTLQTPSGKFSPLALDLDADGNSVVDGAPPLKPSASVTDLLMALQVDQFMTEFIKLGYNDAANAAVMHHWCWESQEASRIWLKHAMSALTSVIGSSRSQMARYTVTVLQEALRMGDSVQEYRRSRIFDGTTETTSVFGALKSECAVYSKEKAEKVIGVLAPLAKVIKEHKVVSNNAIDIVRTFVQRKTAGDTKDAQEEKEGDESLLADALLVLERLKR